jgi:hypothetical protein
MAISSQATTINACGCEPAAGQSSVIIVAEKQRCQDTDTGCAWVPTGRLPAGMPTLEQPVLRYDKAPAIADNANTVRVKQTAKLSSNFLRNA